MAVFMFLTFGLKQDAPRQYKKEFFYCARFSLFLLFDVCNNDSDVISSMGWA